MEKFYLKHLSGSTINKFITDKPGFYDSKVKKTPFTANPNMCRGKAVEHVIAVALEDPLRMNTREEIVREVNQSYDMEMREYALLKGSSYNKLNDDIRDTLPRMAQLGINTYRNLYGKDIVHTQAKVVGEYPELNYEILGYLDFVVYGKEISDCKVVKKSAKRLPQDYCITGSFYKIAGNLPVFYDLLVCNKKSEKHIRLPLTDEDFEFGVSYAVAAGKQILAINQEEDPEKLFKMIMEFPNLDSVWDKVQKKELADQFGIKLRACDLEDEEE